MDNESEEKLKLQEEKSKKQLDTKNRRKERGLERTQKLKEAEMRKVEKNIEKERKKEISEKQKLIKNVLRNVARSTKPDECMKVCKLI